ncbi:hypothetical protein QBC37DRAFT_402589 [Rhypophila decipiens]|uniref:Uncharacterized protein n=1 Tax=Rhypophila decipiens TaxID=261697 RepID=A0AAN7B580_9PEZI|nr:hypothetical protein QBC37DRAFT_402589 [Rhypophila decipiens]
MPQAKGSVSHHCPLKGKNKGNCWKPKGSLICTEHQMICPYHTNWYHIKSEACALCTKVVEQALYTPTYSKFEQEDAASSRKEEISRQKEEKKKNKKVSNRAERSPRNISHPPQRVLI